MCTIMNSIITIIKQQQQQQQKQKRFMQVLLEPRQHDWESLPSIEEHTIT